MQQAVLDGVFRLWQYGLGHSQLVLHAPAADPGADSVSVLFEGVQAVKLRTSYPGLEIRPADSPSRARLLDYAGIPDFLRESELCLTLPTEEDGFVVCGRATVIKGRQLREHASWRWPEPAVVLHTWSRAAS